MGILWKVRAFAKRDLAIDLNYPLSFVLEIAHVLLGVAAFFFFSQLVTEKPAGYTSFAFILVGIAVNACMTTCFVCFSQAIRGSQTSGTLKAILATPTSPGVFLLCSSSYPFFRVSIDALAYLLIGALFGLSLRAINVPAAALVFVLSLMAFSSVGVLSASFTLLFKRGDPLLWLFGSASWLLGGVLYPIDGLPLPLQWLATMLPIAHAADGMRAALLGGGSTRVLLANLGALAVFALIGVPASIFMFRLAVDHAKRMGTLDHR